VLARKLHRQQAALVPAAVAAPLGGSLGVPVAACLVAVRLGPVTAGLGPVAALAQDLADLLAHLLADLVGELVGRRFRLPDRTVLDLAVLHVNLLHVTLLRVAVLVARLRGRRSRVPGGRVLGRRLLGRRLLGSGPTGATLPGRRGRGRGNRGVQHRGLGRLLVRRADRTERGRDQLDAGDDPVGLRAQHPHERLAAQSVGDDEHARQHHEDESEQGSLVVGAHGVGILETG